MMKNRFPKEWLPQEANGKEAKGQEHIALADALEQGELFMLQMTGCTPLILRKQTLLQLSRKTNRSGIGPALNTVRPVIR
jgi:hypothetical protein